MRGNGIQQPFTGIIFHVGAHRHPGFLVKKDRSIFRQEKKDIAFFFKYIRPLSFL
jgi:hypothetical protein